MLEIASAFRGIERPNVRPDTSMQSFNCSLGSFAQRMEQQLDRVKVGRILRQVAEACTNSTDCCFDAGNLMEGDVIGHHNIPTLERAWILERGATGL